MVPSLSRFLASLVSYPQKTPSAYYYLRTEFISSLFSDILKQFSPDLVGASHKVSPVWYEKNSQLNVAKPGAMSPGMADQARELVKRIKDRDDVNIDTDWKLVTLYVGSNDACDYCEEKKKKRDRHSNRVSAESLSMP